MVAPIAAGAAFVGAKLLESVLSRSAQKAADRRKRQFEGLKGATEAKIQASRDSSRSQQESLTQLLGAFKTGLVR